MRLDINKSSSGFALLIFLIVLMGIGGIVLTGFSQQALKSIEQSRFEHNNKILSEAKQALLMFAYNYPQLNSSGIGPGRLPCPDDDNDGLIGTGVDTAQCNSVGRLPALDPRLNLYDIRDADGERLWYAVSEEFRNFNPGDVGGNGNGNDSVNSDSVGTISIFDQSGALIYDGAVNGVAAVIIAPGTVVNNQSRSVTNGDNPFDTTPDTDPGIINAANYLDSFNTFDNSSFVNGSNGDGDGFIFGPIKNQASVVINDQVTIITTDEIVKMAEKATLQAYREAIQLYLDNINGATGLFPRYPWLFDYDVPDVYQYSASALTTPPALPNDIGQLTSKGRIPSIFSSYFADESNSVPFESPMYFGISKSFRVPGDPTLYTLTLDTTTADPLTNVTFTDTGANTGRLQTDASADVTTVELYFWDPFIGTPNWQLCPNDGDEISDCNKDSGGNPDPGSPSNQTQIRVLRVTLELDLQSGFTLDTNYPTSPGYDFSEALVSGLHGRIRAIYNPGSIANISGATFSVTRGVYEVGSFYTESFNQVQQIQDNTDVDFVFPDADVIDQFASNLTVGLYYYPELPLWTHQSENDWHRSIMMAIAQDYAPGGDQDCTTPALTCLDVPDIGGVTDDKIALFTLAGEVAAFTDDGAPGFSDDLSKIFDPENDNANDTFLRRQGDDTVLVLQ